METVQQENDEWRSRMENSTNYLYLNNKLTNKEKQGDKILSTRYHSQNKVDNFVEDQNKKLNQFPVQLCIDKEEDESMIPPSIESNNSKGFKLTYSKVIMTNHNKIKLGLQLDLKLKSI